MQRLNPRQTPESPAPLRAAVAAEPDERPDRRPAKNPAPTEDNKPPAVQFSPVRKLTAGSHTQQPTVSGQELVTSRFTAGGRGLVLAALKQRSHSAPSRRAVTVQLLEPGPLQNSSRDGQEPPCLRNSSQHSLGVLGVQMEAGLSSGFHGNNASTANLIKTQALMEAQMSRLNDNVHQLLQAHRDRGCLSQQILHHLETLHSQQLQLQSQLLESATTVATGPASTSHQLTATAPVFSSQQPISSNTSHVATVTAGCYRVPEQSRGVSMTTDAGSLSDVMSGRANELLTEMKHLRAEMKKLLIAEASVKATRPGSGHQQSQSTSIHIHPTQSNHSSSTQVQSKPVVPSTLEMAGLVLRQVQRQKKVLEENLGGQLRAQRGAVLHCQLDALAASRNSTHNLRIKKMVDDWIDTLTEEIQVDISQDAVAKHSARRDAVVTSQQRGAGSAAPTFQRTPVRTLRGTGHSSSSHGLRPGAWPERATVRRPDSAQEEAESYLSHLYGSAPHDGTRRTLKKSPYLRFKSPPSPPSKKLRPRLVERVRGVKLKSCKTQTCLAPTLIEPSGPPQYHYIVDSTHLAPADPTVSYSVPTAIPLGPPTQPQQEVTSLTVPPTSAMVAKEDRDSKLLLQEEQQHHAGNAPPHVDIIDRKTEEEETEDEAFVGPDFLCVADVTQDEGSVEEMVHLEGGPPPPSVLYHGPSFPPQTCTALPSQDQAHVPALDPQRDGLENQLLEWVEQQIMSRMISEMYHPPPSDPTQRASADPSDIVEAAGCGGLQLFVDSGVSVDSGLIKQLVEEVLTEHVALMLEHREAPGTQPEPVLEAAEPDSGPYQEEELVPLVPTPEPTPPPCSTLSIRETPPLNTPPPSEPTSLLNEDSAQPITEPVVTPTFSLEPTPTDGSPPAAHQTTPPLTSENPELSLAEQQDTHTQLTMSVRPPGPGPGPGPEVRPASPHSSSEESSVTSSNSVTTGTDAALRPVSDGELLSSVQLEATMTDEEALCTFSTSLQELQDMDFDPPSEGQVRGQAHLPANMEDRVPERERPQPEGSQGSAVQEEEEDMSVGEVKGNHTTKHRSHCEMIAACRHRASESPGHSPDLSPCTDVQALSFETTNQSSLTMSILGEQIGTLTSDLQTGMCLSPPPALEDRFTPGVCSGHNLLH